MLTEKQVSRLTNLNVMAEKLQKWCHEKTQNQGNISPTALQTIETLCEMPKAEQEKHVILDDVLIDCRSNSKTFRLNKK